MNGKALAGSGTGGPPASLTPLVYRLPDAGRVLGGLSRRTVSNLLAAGELEAVPVGHIRMVTRASIEAYLERQRANQAALEACVNRTEQARAALAA